jgi:nitroimidazol reductase NimA-like FMN-containing flavoprotein (pyridoxamine 5'-phosphate oxidase superfamily)
MAKYHMNKAEREITDNGQLLEILERGKYAIIAMCRDNEPYIVTMSFGYDPARHALYFHSAVKGRKLDIIAANPAVCATIIEDGGYLVNQCSHRYRSVVLDGNMHIVDDPAERLHGMETISRQLETDLAARKEKISRLDGEAWRSMAILRLDIEEMTGKSGQ